MNNYLKTFIQILRLLYRNKNIIKQFTALDKKPLSPLQAIRRTHAVVKAMNEFRKTHSNCEWCGSVEQIEIHHIISLWLDITKASDPTNFIALCKKCHFVVGHNCSFANRCNENIVQMCKDKKITQRVR